MKNIAFCKYTSFGNNFVIVDELEDEHLTEWEAPLFASEAANPCFGIGCDNLILIQRARAKKFADINDYWGYWQAPPRDDCAELVFRMFEPSGAEALSCGNGLMSVAHLLRRMHRIERARILTEVPLQQPKAIEIGSNGTNVWAALGVPRRTPDELAALSHRRAISNSVDELRPIEVQFRSDDLRAYGCAGNLQLRGYLTFTGEPHLVVFPNQCFVDPDLTEAVFASRDGVTQGAIRRRLSVGTWLVRRIGAYLNDKLRDQFPQGINVNFARIRPLPATDAHGTPFAEQADAIEYRCFERGIDRETLACGTGAAAVYTVAKALGLIDQDEVSVLPHLCRRYEPDASLGVSQAADGAVRLEGSPRMLFKGNYAFAADQQPRASLDYDTGDVLALEQQLDASPLVPATASGL